MNMMSSAFHNSEVKPQKKKTPLYYQFTLPVEVTF